MDFFAELSITGCDPGADAEASAKTIAHHEVTHLKPAQRPADLRSYYDRFVEALGTPVDIAEDYAAGGAPTGERWAEIRFDADIDNEVAFRYSSNAQPLHTDESYVSSPAGIMLFYCVHRAPSGGETIYVSGRQLVDWLGSTEPELLHRLRATDVRYAKASDYKHRPIIVIDDDGRVDLNYNYFCADPDQSAEARRLNERFHQLLGDEIPTELVQDVGLDPGEAVAWHDDRVLHGRRAFAATKTDDRLIWKTGVVLDA